MTKTLAEIEREAIRQRLEQFHGDTALAAKSLGVSRNKIYLFLQIECARKQSS